jgi:hypothetical protein
MKNSHIVAIVFVFLLPVIILSLPWGPVWLRRTIAVSSFTFFVTAGVFWLGLSPKSTMFREETPARLKSERVIRIAVVAFGILFFVYQTSPLASDLFHLVTGEKPTKFTAMVTYRTSSLKGALVGERSVRFGRGGASYYLFYSWTSPLNEGESYEFTVLPRSRMILDFRTPGR